MENIITLLIILPKSVDASIPLNVIARSVVIMDPQSSNYGIGVSSVANGKTYVRLQMEPGEALILRLATQITLLNYLRGKYLEKICVIQV